MQESQTDTAQPPEVVHQVRWAEFDRLTTKRGWANDAERARRLGISHAYLNNLRAGRARIGGKFIHGCVTAWGPFVLDVLLEDPAAPVDEDAA